MNNTEQQIRAQARKLLETKQVDLVIGYRNENLPLRTSPCFIRDAKHVEQLVWNPLCENNLATYLVGRHERIALVAKGCDARAIVVLINENQIVRENLTILGVACKGIIDRKKIESALEDREIEEVSFEGTRFLVKGAGFSKSFELKDIMHGSCLTCRYKNPPVSDIMIGGKVQEQGHEDEEIKQMEQKSSKERWEWFNKQFSKCIRCYACRNACPICYCNECFVDQKFPAWLGKTDDLSDTLCFHIMRALHTTGRCVECGACARACPSNIDLRMLTAKIAKNVKELFNAEPGLKLGEKYALASFSEDDPQDFIK
ncbi:MAG: Coenzyme F420 hydrogenase/dehydrogenase, beta subunit C-terminal domain [Planctomycetes bacterium]|nr:Coenzyme F420 hydrogenase/dehydrogenase, beta subunit C-terminal domain [Planctomycetota bacterium]